MALSVEDRLDIHDLLVRYGFVVDDRDWDVFACVFTPDAVVDFGSDDPPMGLAPIVGVQEIVRQFRDILTHPLQHVIVNHVMDPVSDKEVVVRSKALFPVPGDGVFEGLYRDVVVRTPEGWRIKHKSMTIFDRGGSPWQAENYKRMVANGATFRQSATGSS
jgi:hypothetical protein